MPFAPLQVVQQAAAAPDVLVTALTTGIIVGLGKWHDHRKGKDRDHKSGSILTRLENGVKAVQKDVSELRDEVRRETAGINRRVDSTNHVLTGSADGDGPNGLRAKANDHEDRIRVLEQRPLRPADVGTYADIKRA